MHTAVSPAFTDADVLYSACADLGLPAPEKVKGYPLFFDNEDTLVHGFAVRLPSWLKSVVFQFSPSRSRLVYDNWGGRFGASSELRNLLQAYTKAAVRKSAAENFADCTFTDGDTHTVTVENVTYSLKFVPREKVWFDVAISSESESIPAWLLNAVGTVAEVVEPASAGV